MDYSLQLKKLPPNFTLIIPFRTHEAELRRELSLKNIEVLVTHESFLITAPVPTLLQSRIIWAQDVWRNCQLSEAQESSSAIKLLKSFSSLGCYYASEPNEFVKKAAKNTRQLELKRIKYIPQNPFNFKFTAWTAVKNIFIYSQQTEKRFPFGWHEFEEDKTIPPNRAYLKLWEVFSVYGPQVKKSAEVIELGASPGGWSWVLSQLCHKVYTIDRAPLAPQIQKIPNIMHIEGDAFKLDPEHFKNCTWLFSDLICTPEKLFETVCFWKENSQVKNFVCTIKFKGDCDFEMIEKFLKLMPSYVIHLYHNKNEVTWIALNTVAGDSHD